MISKAERVCGGRPNWRGCARGGAKGSPSFNGGMRLRVIQKEPVRPRPIASSFCSADEGAPRDSARRLERLLSALCGNILRSSPLERLRLTLAGGVCGASCGYCFGNSLGGYGAEEPLEHHLPQSSGGRREGYTSLRILFRRKQIGLVRLSREKTLAGTSFGNEVDGKCGSAILSRTFLGGV